MREPYNRIMMMLSYMKGPKIDDWVQEKATILETAVANGTADPNNEHVWNTFIEEFTDAFTDTTRREQATLDLINIQMKGEDLDTYISTFHHLRERAGWEPDAQGTMLMFRRGLKRPLATAIVERTHPRPQTLQQWYQSARAHHAAYTENKATFANPFLQHDKNRWEQALKSKGKSWRRNEDAMDVDAVDTTGSTSRGGQQARGQYNRAAFLTNEERKTLLKERRCFNCRAQGHVSKQCPKKGKTTAATPTIRATEATAVSEPAPAYDGPIAAEGQGSSGGAALDLIRSMNDEERTKLLDDLCAEQGF